MSLKYEQQNFLSLKSINLSSFCTAQDSGKPKDSSVISVWGQSLLNLANQRQDNCLALFNYFWFQTIITSVCVHINGLAYKLCNTLQQIGSVFFPFKICQTMCNDA